VKRGLLGLGAKIVQVENGDPVVGIVTKFFQRFIREKLGRNQRTCKKESMVKGLGGEERRFVDREVIPEMRKYGVISEADAGQGTEIYIFNVEWQSDGDGIIFENRISDRVRDIIERLKSKTDRYNLV
jgi:hypothetical protein